MSIELTTPYNPGDNDPGKQYRECQITSIIHNAILGSVQLGYEYGDSDPEGNWIRGPGAQNKSLMIIGDEFMELASLPHVGSETVFQGVKRVCYQWMIDHDIAAGTII